MDLESIFQNLAIDTEVFTVQDVLLTVVLAFALTLVIAWTYRATYRGTAYSQSFVQTLVLVSVVVSVIMLIIGSNIARAFTLVGALSIIRFRNAIRETRDVGFIFFAMAIGMAAGTRFYLVGIVATFAICLMILFMVRFELFGKEVNQQLLKVRLPADLPYAELMRPILDRYVRRYDLVAMETVQAGTLTELVYTVELIDATKAQALLAAIGQVNGNNKVVLITGQPEADL